MLDIPTFSAGQGNVLYKAFAHPMAAPLTASLVERLAGARGYAMLHDPAAEAWRALAPGLTAPTTVLVQDHQSVGTERFGRTARGLSELGRIDERVLLVCAFDSARLVAAAERLAPPGTAILSFDQLRLPPGMLTNPRRYLDPLNFATNFAFFRDADGLSTRLVTANYWANYGARGVRLWLRLHDQAGSILAEWEQSVPDSPAGIVIDSRDVRARFALPEFTGQLFIHAIGIAGHDVVKYALDTIGAGNEASLSVTHDANAWPSDRYAGLPAPRPDEQVVLWLQNSHAVPIPAGAIGLDRMGAEAPISYAPEIGPFASVAVDVGALMPRLAWPSQLELRAGRHVVRPRYEITRHGRRRIAHMNVERADLVPDPNIPDLGDAFGRGYLLPFPILPPDRFRTIVQPTPMAERQASLPLRLDVFAADGTLVGERFLGCLPRCFDLAADLDEWSDRIGPEGGHAELVYDFRDGGEADGWMHAVMRFEGRQSGHVAETSFGAHVFNTIMTYRGEPQSYSGPPPGLTTRLFLKLGEGGRQSFACVIYPASGDWCPLSSTRLDLHDSDGHPIGTATIGIARRGSAMVFPDRVFEPDAIRRAGAGGYVLIRDATCRLFGYHGQMDAQGGFSIDHMFGF